MHSQAGSHFQSSDIQIEFEESQALHVVCGDRDLLAFLAALIVLQAWTHGISEEGVPLLERRPLLLITDTPGRLGEGFLNLRLPVAQIEPLCRKRRVRLYEKTGQAGTDAASYWENLVRQGDTRNRFHNFFPAYTVFRAGAEPKPISDREFLGRADDAGPAVLISRCTDREGVNRLINKHRPFLVLIHSENSTAALGTGLPTIISHDSIFALKFLKFYKIGLSADACLTQPSKPSAKDPISMSCSPNCRPRRQAFCQMRTVPSPASQKNWQSICGACFAMSPAPLFA